MKIQIIGAAGTGKSTLGEYIAEKEQIKWIDTDSYIWKDNQFAESYATDERLTMYQNDRTTFKDFVASGSVFAWNPDGFMDRDLLVFLYLDEELHFERLQKRELDRGGASALILDKQGNPTNDFLEWCKTYHTAKKTSDIGTYAEHSYQLKHSSSPVLKLNSNQSLDSLYYSIISALKKEQNNH